MISRSIFGVCAVVVSLVVSSGVSEAVDVNLATRGFSQSDAQVSGRVVDSSGAPVPGASVEIDIGGVESMTVIETGADGRFVFVGLQSDEVIIRVSAQGFAEARQVISLISNGLTSAHVVLQPEELFESVTVTASRGVKRLATPASTSVLTSAEILNSASLMVDDVLRNTAGFSLFRRSSSRVANPTTQGVTLRGVSGSGASRTLVLADGLPLNDPFGNWVYWNRIPQAAIERVEVVRGAAGDLYGADALGGVIQILTFEPDRARLRASVNTGSHNMKRVSLFGGGRNKQGWTSTVGAELLETDGFVVVSEDDRGAIDVPADSDYLNLFGTAGYSSNDWRVHARGAVYREERSNGTPVQVNDTDWQQASVELKGTTFGGAWVVRAGSGTQTYAQSFSAVASDRNSERRVRDQRTPSTFVNLAGEWIRPVGAHVLRIGAEEKYTRSTLNETRFSFMGGVPSGPFLFGGTEIGGSVYGQASLTASDFVTVVLGGRGDFWKSEPRDSTSPTHSVSFFSPRISAAWQSAPNLTLRASAYRSYRTPTLNELHRGFRVGSVVTNPNPLLEPERLTGMEGGVLMANGRMSTRVTGFLNYLDDAIANITLDVTPKLTTRQRQNAGRIRATGIEIETDIRPIPELTVNALAAFTTSRFRDAPSLPNLRGNRVPQVPRYQFGAGVGYTDPKTLTLSAQFRIVGEQFDDDLNERRLDNYTIVDIQASRVIARGVHAFIGCENILDVEYDIGLSGVRRIGLPRTIHGGLRLFLP